MDYDAGYDCILYILNNPSTIIACIEYQTFKDDYSL